MNEYDEPIRERKPFQWSRLIGPVMIGFLAVMGLLVIHELFSTPRPTVRDGECVIVHFGDQGIHGIVTDRGPGLAWVLFPSGRTGRVPYDRLTKEPCGP